MNLAEALAAEGKAPTTFADQKSYVAIVLKKNVGLFDLTTTTGGHPSPPHTGKMMPVDDPTSQHFGKPILRSQFDMNHVHRIAVPSIAPKTPKRRPGEPESYYQRRVESEYERSIAAQADSMKLRNRLRQLEREGYVEIVEDPENFMDLDDVELSDDEQAALTADAIETQAVEAKKLKKAVGRG